MADAGYGPMLEGIDGAAIERQVEARHATIAPGRCSSHDPDTATRCMLQPHPVGTPHVAHVRWADAQPRP